MKERWENNNWLGNRRIVAGSGNLWRKWGDEA
jgi:hypothetical protein